MGHRKFALVSSSFLLDGFPLIVDSWLSILTKDGRRVEFFSDRKFRITVQRQMQIDLCPRPVRVTW